MKESLFAAEERAAKLSRCGDILEALDETVDFPALARMVDQALPRRVNPRGGRPAYPTELMVRCLVIAQLYNLSDEALEYQLLDRFSFQRFTGLTKSSRIPDAKTFWAFRERFNQAGQEALLFEAFNLQRAQKGYLARGGQLIDASLVNAPIQHFTKEDQASLQEGKVPEDWNAAKRAQKDLDASWTKKHGQWRHGYKVSINADKRYKRVRKAKVDTASVHDTHAFLDVLDGCNTSQGVYADKGYVDAVREARLNAAGCRMHIQRKAPKGKPLSDCQKRRNTRIARTRARVEHVFAGLSQMGERIVRVIGQARVTLPLHLKLATYNMRRLVSLKKMNFAPF